MPGLSGNIQSRQVQYIMRLSGLYAVLDKSSEVFPHHLAAAVAAWQYCADSANDVFGMSSGDPVADKILEVLRQKTKLTRTEISGIFQNNQSVNRIDQAIKILTDYQLARMTQQNGNGRPSMVLELLGASDGTP